MLKWLLILLLISAGVSAQQTIVLCDYNKTEFIYTSESNPPGNLNWVVDGIMFPGQTLMIDWKDYSLGKHFIAVSFQLGGCETKQSFEVNLKECPEIIVWIPNSFTPNGDGTNDVFAPVSYKLDPDEYIFEIYNRWGERIFFTNDPAVAWDGTYAKRICPDDIYAYKVYIRQGSKLFSSIGRVNLMK
jgi:gliding motility-associated-like protein